MKSSLNKLWEKVIANILVVIMTAGNLMVIGNGMVTYAEGTIEAQDEATAHENVEFGAYFLSEGEQIHEITSNVEEKINMYVHLNVKSAGHLKSGVIEIENANYEIAGELEESEIIGAIEENRLELKQIGFGTDATIEIPVEVKSEEFLPEDVSKESKVVLKGIYVTKEGKEVKIEKEIKLNVKWEETVEYEVKSEIIGYKKTENSTIVKEKITIEGKNKIPVKETKVEVKVPRLAETKAGKVVVNSNRTEMTNGKEYEEVKIEWEYEETEEIVRIKTENEEGKRGEGKDEYIITYEYNEIKDEEVEVRGETKVEVKNYAEKEETKIEEVEETIVEEKGTIVNTEISISEINKAKMYANNNGNEKRYETEYKIREIVNNAKAEEVEIKDKEEVFKDKEGKEYNTKIGEENYTYYKTTKVEVSNFKEVLGEDGEIIIESIDGERIGTINKLTEEEDGKYVVRYEEEYGEIVIKISAEISAENLYIEHEKGIKAELGYSREEIKEFTEISKKVEVNGVEEEKVVSLKEPENKLTLEVNKEVISKAEEEIEIRLELGNNREDAMLYTEPTVEITLPEFVEEAEIRKVNLLLEEELEVGDSEVKTNEEGKKVVEIKLNGSQTKYNEVANGNGSIIIVGLNIKNKQMAEEGKIEAKIENSRTYIMIKSILEAEEEENSEELETLRSIPTSEEAAQEEQKQEETEEPKTEETPKKELEPFKGEPVNIKEENPEQANEGELEGVWYSQYVFKDNLVLTANIQVGSKSPKEGDELTYYLSLTPYTTQYSLSEDNDFKVTLVLPEELEYVDTREIVNDFIADGNTYTVEYNEETRTITWGLNKLYKKNMLEINTKIIKNVDGKEIRSKAVLKYLDKTMETPELIMDFSDSKLSLTTETNNLKTINQKGDNIEFIINANNKGVTRKISAEFEVPEGLLISKYCLGKDIETTSALQEFRSDEIIIEGDIDYALKFTVLVNNVEMSASERSKTLTVRAKINDEEMSWNVVVENPNYGQEPTPVEPTPTPNHYEPLNGEHTISGLAWLDENENGIKEVGEKLLNGIRVELVEAATSKVIWEEVTDGNGNYTFSNVAEGRYQVVFRYNAGEYRTTEYLKTGKPEINSSTIESKEEGQAVTDIITITGEDVQHINIGLIKILKFDMKVEQTVSKLILQNSVDGVKEIPCNSTLAKTDINSRYINNTTVLAVYSIKIKNEGDIEGRVKEIVDYMPRDMVFSSELNPTWAQNSNGNLYNSELKDIDIKPGETKEITLILKKTMTENNVGLSHNVVELSKVENAKNLKDIDSTPGNRAQGEDDMAEADVLIGIRTGEEVAYVTLSIVIGIMITTGIYMIKRKVLSI